MSRTTIRVAHVLEKVNRMLENANYTQEQKMAVSMLIEDILHETGNYAGYSHHQPFYLPNGEKNPKCFEYTRTYWHHKRLTKGS